MSWRVWILLWVVALAFVGLVAGCALLGDYLGGAWWTLNLAPYLTLFLLGGWLVTRR